MRRFLVVLGVIALVGGLGSTEVAQAAPTPALTLSPAELTINDTATPGGSAGLVNVRTGKKSVVYQTPVSFTNAAFNDTGGGGSCYEDYLSLGQPIPARTDCTINVFFQARQVGTATATMTVQICKSWQFASGHITCRSNAGSAATRIVGTVTNVDLEITSVQMGSPTGATPYGYTAVVRNNGTDSVDQSFIGVQAYYSSDLVLDLNGPDLPACANSAAPGTLQSGHTVSVPVGCSTGPRASDHFLLVEVDFPGVVVESNETNNRYNHVFGSPGVDLVVSRIAFEGGSSARSYTVTITNVGQDPATNPGLYMQGYFSPNAVIDDDESAACGLQVLKPETIAGLSSIDVLVECSALPRTGDNYLLVDMDFTNVVAETNNANNVGVLALP